MIAVITESQWFLALSVMLLLCMRSPESKLLRLGETCLFFVCALTGPFCLFMLVIGLLPQISRRGDLWQICRLGIVAAGVIIQLTALLSHLGARPHGHLGATPEWFVRILAGQVYLGALLGGNQLSSSGSMISLCLIALGCSALVVFCALRAPVPFKAILLFTALAFAASLLGPTANPPPGTTSWQMIAAVPGTRYLFFPSLAFLWSLAYCVCSRTKLIKIVSASLLFTLCIGLERDFRYRDLGFAARPRLPDRSHMR